jgi:hypothetical protein
LEIVDEAVPIVLKLELLSDKAKDGNWAASSITDLRSTCALLETYPNLWT